LSKIQVAFWQKVIKNIFIAILIKTHDQHA